MAEIRENSEDKETKTALLNTNNAFSKDDVTKRDSKKKSLTEDVEKGKKNKSTWSGIGKKWKLLWPFIWPKGDFWLQLRVIVCVVIIILTRGLSVLVPLSYKRIVNTLAQPSAPLVASEDVNNATQDITVTSSSGYSGSSLTKDGTTPTASNPHSVYPPFCWEYILVFILLKSLHGGSGYLNCLRSYLWIAVSQSTRKKTTVQLFAHLHSLSLNWHTQRKTGEVIKVMDRGVNSINIILGYALFHLAPVIADIIIAIVFFCTVFDVWTGVIVLATMIVYLVFTIIINEWRTKFRRQMNENDNERSATSVDSILNFETVKYYSAEDWEVGRYEKAVDRFLEMEGLLIATMNMQNSGQKTLQMFCMFCGSLVISNDISQGSKAVGEFALFIMYLEQLYTPLDSFGIYWRTLQQAFIDMESMFDMMDIKPDILDAPDAKDVSVSEGAIEFKNVEFHYNPLKPVLRRISFNVPAGQTFALVGNSGGGKSTILRLLFRFYDIQGGSITIDGQDICKVTQKSLRKQIGVVPQDTVLFNKDLLYNIRYGRPSATDKEVEEAAKAADIHERIVGLPNGYNSRVGERGLKLSGGEKQRIAIARTILKSPQIILLDEATSALDTHSERNIQTSLQEVCKGKTTIMVAHRLSTIIHADQILVIQEGEIIERGTHDELLELDGTYCKMWTQQLQSVDVEELTNELCTCCPIGAGHGMNADEDEINNDNDETKVGIFDKKISSAIDAAPYKDQAEQTFPLIHHDDQTQKSDVKDLNESWDIIPPLTNTENREGLKNRIVDPDNDMAEIITDWCKCPCHIARKVYEKQCKKPVIITQHTCVDQELLKTHAGVSMTIMEQKANSALPSDGKFNEETEDCDTVDQDREKKDTARKKGEPTIKRKIDKDHDYISVSINDDNDGYHNKQHFKDSEFHAGLKSETSCDFKFLDETNDCNEKSNQIK